ncbi:cation-transporting ATPase [Microbacterium sp. cx-59]|uniref:cation-transporting ATPase n=1 Tax=Microbacterium sp. cx-59 TaxID=2891207 RepID=UPI001E41C4F7|nr:cation-transporting ATPase [Microbacterium sp. cx-59]MCC4909167.1 cation-transporting ATPase [Microbacterium sp. cx-59]
MGKLSKIIGMAKKALDENGSGSGSGSRTGSSGGGTDWTSMVRGAASALTGDNRSSTPSTPPSTARYVPGESAYGQNRSSAPATTPPSGPADAADRAAIARYDYLLQTADPHQIEQVHREAFARLSPEQRAHIAARMQSELPPHEHPRSAEAPDLARAAARTEASRPGVLRGLLARAGGGRGRSRMGGAGLALGGAGLAAGGVLGAVAGGAVISSVAGPLLEQAAGFGVDFDALAAGIDLDALGGLDEFAAGAGDLASGVGDQVSGVGEQITDFGSGVEIPGLGDLFGR